MNTMINYLLFPTKAACAFSARILLISHVVEVVASSAGVLKVRVIVAVMERCAAVYKAKPSSV